MKKGFNFKKRKGFSIIEIMICLVILAILVLMVFAGTKYIDKSRETRTTSDLSIFDLAAQTMLIEHNELATQEYDSTTFSATADDGKNQPEELIKLFNTYLDDGYKLSGSAADDIFSDKTDPWSKEYQVVFEATPADTQFKIYVYSYGADSQTETAGSEVDEDDLILIIANNKGVTSSFYYGFNSEHDGASTQTLVSFEDTVA